MSLGLVDIANIKLDPKSRDDIPAILLGLQHIYTTPELQKSVFEILQNVLPERKNSASGNEGINEKVSPNTGRPGMEQWKILVLAVLRAGLNTNYDRLHDLANNHATIRQMLGHNPLGDETRYSLQAIKDNLKLFTPEILAQINNEVIKSGHHLIKKNSREETGALHGRCDSFVFETRVHFPTDLNLLLDATRKAILASYKLAKKYEISGWRQYVYHLIKLKKLYRKIQTLRHSTAKNAKRVMEREREINRECARYINLAEKLIIQSEELVKKIKDKGFPAEKEIIKLKEYQDYARTFIDQIFRRVILDEKIPHSEKIFSIFEPHTEWINKGKAGVPVELGLRVCIMEDQHQFILHAKVMEQLTDDQIAVKMVEETKKYFPELNVVSFDKGFHSPENQEALKKYLDHVILPKKGRLTQEEKLREGKDEFKNFRKKHSAVESAINGLEQSGLDSCPDHGIEAFKRYVNVAVLSRNIKRLGVIIRKQAEEKENRKREKYKKAA
jgi:hypothetical protein